MKYLIYTSPLQGLIITYLFMSFILLDLNLINWSEQDRGFLFVLGLFVTLGIFSFYMAILSGQIKLK